MKVHTHWLRVLHKWIGLIIGLQFLLWTLSGAMMALLDMEQVAGGPARELPVVEIAPADAWPSVRAQLGNAPVRGLTLKPLLDRYVYEVSTPRGVEMFDAASGVPFAVDATAAERIAGAAYLGEARVRKVTALRQLTLPVREHELPIWRVDFADKQNSSFYVSGKTGALLERRNETWRLWDLFWMLHIMDYTDRTSFNNPLIIAIGLAAAWLAITGLWLLVRTGWKSDFKRIRRQVSAHRSSLRR